MTKGAAPPKRGCAIINTASITHSKEPTLIDIPQQGGHRLLHPVHGAVFDGNGDSRQRRRARPGLDAADRIQFLPGTGADFRLHQSDEAGGAAL